jgi:hypothetical protein
MKVNAALLLYATKPINNGMHCRLRLARDPLSYWACGSALTMSTSVFTLGKRGKSPVMVWGELVSDLFFTTDNEEIALFSKHV